MSRIVVALLGCLTFATPALAQSSLQLSNDRSISFVTKDAAPRAQAATPVRQGFTVLVNLGLGFQKDDGLEESAIGLAGANVGVGGFLTEDLALLFRISGTKVRYDFGGFGELDQLSGVVGTTVQYWATDRLTIEGGGGVGFWRTEDENERGFGLILGVGAVVFKKGTHNLVVGAEYAPGFTDSGTVHNFGITFGYQFHR